MGLFFGILSSIRIFFRIRFAVVSDTSHILIVSFTLIIFISFICLIFSFFKN